MGLLSRLFPRTETRTAVDYGDGWEALAAMSVAGGGTMSARLAENLAAVNACVGAISSGLASLPVALYRSEGDARAEVSGHPVARLLRAPNTRQTWPDWLEWTLASVLLHGNALSAVEYDGAGRPVALRPIPWPSVTVKVLPGGRLAYDVTTGKGQVQRHLEGDVFHLRDRSDDGAVGRARLSRAPDVLNGALRLQAYAGTVWQNSARPSGLVKMGAATAANPDMRKRFRAQFNRDHAGPENAGKVVFGDSDADFVPFSLSPEAAQALGSRQFSVIEVARLFNVPPPIIQDYSHATFTNASQASTWFASNTLTPWARKLEAEFSRSVILDPALHIEIDLSGLLRGDYVSRWTANVAAVRANILTADEVRAAEGYGPLPAAKAKEPTPPADSSSGA